LNARSLLPTFLVLFTLMLLIGVVDDNSPGSSSAIHPSILEELKLDISAYVPTSCSLSPPENGIEEVFSDVCLEAVGFENPLRKTGLGSHGSAESSAPIDIASANENENERTRLWQQVTQESMTSRTRYVMFV
jgi:hypothetical protein